MKKLVMAAAAFIIAAAPAYADENTSAADKITIEQQEGMADTVIVTGYDGEGILKYASQSKAENGRYTIEIQPEITSVKLFDMNGTVFEINPNPDTAPSEEPQESTLPEATALPSEEPNLSASPEATEQPESTRKPLNPSYPKEADQVTAPGVIKNVLTAANDDGTYCSLTVLIQGKETVVPVYDESVIESAPSAYEDLKGKQAYSLKKGDVIYLRTSINGKEIRGIDLLCRPSNIMNGSARFAELFNGGQAASATYAGNKIAGGRTYVLGIIAKKGNNTLTLYSGDGKAENSMDIDYTDDTVTYIYDMSSKEDPYIASPKKIVKSSIPNLAYDDDDNITYASKYSYNAALVRLVDGTAVDIVVFENIEDSK